MSSAAKSKCAWIVMSAVEGLKDQGFARWNYTIRSLNQYAKNRIKSYSQANKKLSASSSSAISHKIRDQKSMQSDESLRKVMFLSCWGPN